MFMSEKVTILEVKLEKEPLPKQKIKPPFNFNTTQNNVAIPTKELIKNNFLDLLKFLSYLVITISTSNNKLVSARGSVMRSFSLKSIATTILQEFLIG